MTKPRVQSFARCFARGFNGSYYRYGWVFLFYSLSLYASTLGDRNTPSSDPSIHFPEDDSPHSEDMEWWYYTGHLRTPDKLSFGFELTFFQAKTSLGLYGRVAQFAITDSNQQTFRFRTELAPGKYDSNPDGFLIAIPQGWSASHFSGQDRLVAQLSDQDTLDLKLTQLTDPILQFDNGYIHYRDPKTGKPIGLAAYYSRPRFAVQGSIRVGGKNFILSDGEAWFDHEWGQIPPEDWTWFSIQLEDGTNIMTYETRSPGTSLVLARGGSVVVEGNVTKTIQLGPDDFSFSSSDLWLSPHTQIQYPTSFLLKIPALEVNLSLNAVMKDQELFQTLLDFPTYWEGAMTVKGSAFGKTVQGSGYVEQVLRGLSNDAAASTLK